MQFSGGALSEADRGGKNTHFYTVKMCYLTRAARALSLSLTLSLFPSFSLSLPPCLWGASEREPQAQRLLNAHTPEGGINSLADIHRECLPPRLSLSPFLPPFRSLPLHQPSSRLFSFLPPRCWCSLDIYIVCRSSAARAGKTALNLFTRSRLLCICACVLFCSAEQRREKRELFILIFARWMIEESAMLQPLSVWICSEWTQRISVFSC